MREDHIDVGDLTVGMKVSVQWKQPLGAGQGGTILALRPDGVVLECGTAKRIRDVLWVEVDHVLHEVPFDADECLNYNPDECSGPVDWRWIGVGDSSRLRCKFHGDRRVASVSELELAAQSPLAPSWFDESAAGERWEDD